MVNNHGAMTHNNSGHEFRAVDSPKKLHNNLPNGGMGFILMEHSLLWGGTLVVNEEGGVAPSLGKNNPWGGGKGADRERISIVGHFCGTQ